MERNKRENTTDYIDLIETEIEYESGIIGTVWISREEHEKQQKKLAKVVGWCFQTYSLTPFLLSFLIGIAPVNAAQRIRNNSTSYSLEQIYKEETPSLKTTKITKKTKNSDKFQAAKIQRKVIITLKTNSLNELKKDQQERQTKLEQQRQLQRESQRQSRPSKESKNGVFKALTEKTGAKGAKGSFSSLNLQKMAEMQKQIQQAGQEARQEGILLAPIVSLKSLLRVNKIRAGFNPLWLLALGLPTTVGTISTIKKVIMKLLEGRDQMEKGKFPTKILDILGIPTDNSERRNKNVLERVKDVLITRTNVGVGAAFLGFLLSKKSNKNYLFKSEAKNGMISTIGKGISSATEIVLGAPIQPMPIRVFQFFLRNWIITVPFLFLILGTSYFMASHKSSDAFSVKDILEMALKNAKEVNANLQNYFNRDHTEQLQINKKLSEKIDKQEKNTQESLKAATKKVDEVLARNGELGFLNRDLQNDVANKNLVIQQIQRDAQKTTDHLNTCLSHADNVEVAYIECTKTIQAKETLPYNSQPLLGENSVDSELKNNPRSQF